MIYVIYYYAQLAKFAIIGQIVGCRLFIHYILFAGSMNSNLFDNPGSCMWFMSAVHVCGSRLWSAVRVFAYYACIICLHIMHRIGYCVRRGIYGKIIPPDDRIRAR